MLVTIPLALQGSFWSPGNVVPRARLRIVAEMDLSVELTQSPVSAPVDRNLKSLLQFVFSDLRLTDNLDLVGVRGGVFPDSNSSEILPLSTGFLLPNYENPGKEPSAMSRRFTALSS